MDGGEQLRFLVRLTRWLDFLGVARAAERALCLLVRTGLLNAAERTAAAEVQGRDALAWERVRVAEGGALGPIFRANGGRAFTAWHVICLPGVGERVRANLALMVHELAHVYQYERVGSAYMVEALRAQHAGGGYQYGKAAGLRQAREAGMNYRDLNREQQAQVAEDYYLLLHETPSRERPKSLIDTDLAAYLPFIEDMRAGRL